MKIKTGLNGYLQAVETIKKFKKRLKNETDEIEKRLLTERIRRKENQAQARKCEIVAVLEHIPNQRHREAARLYYIDGLNIHEIADIIGVTSWTVSRMLTRARETYDNIKAQESGGSDPRGKIKKEN